MEKKLILGLIILFTLQVSSYGDNVAVTPQEYIVTINKIEFYNEDTSSWITVGEGKLSFDIASVNAGQTVGSYVDASAVAEGTYTQGRVYVSLTFYLKASATIDGTTYYTTEGGYENPFPDSELQGYIAAKTTTDPNRASRGISVLTEQALERAGFDVVGDSFIFEGEVLLPIVVKKGFTKKVRINFNVTNSVAFEEIPSGDVVCYPLPPVLTFKVID
ncbi:MAG: hypothetical protein N2606_04765 [Candidatus Omnitrophica bacterium]|nr:hypothetical protein [Candidatus Omnitrophota bacterium]